MPANPNFFSRLSAWGVAAGDRRCWTTPTRVRWLVLSNVCILFSFCCADPFLDAHRSISVVIAGLMSLLSKRCCSTKPSMVCRMVAQGGGGLARRGPPGCSGDTTNAWFTASGAGPTCRSDTMAAVLSGFQLLQHASASLAGLRRTRISFRKSFF